jgi:hypothetical protein
LVERYYKKGKKLPKEQSKIKLDWLGCDCGKWFHRECCGVSAEEYEEIQESFVCFQCVKNPGSGKSKQQGKEEEVEEKGTDAVAEADKKLLLNRMEKNVKAVLLTAVRQVVPQAVFAAVEKLNVSNVLEELVVPAFKSAKMESVEKKMKEIHEVYVNAVLKQLNLPPSVTPMETESTFSSSSSESSSSNLPASPPPLSATTTVPVAATTKVAESSSESSSSIETPRYDRHSAG